LKPAAVSLALALAATGGPAAAFDPIAFFTGPSHGTGRMEQVLKATRSVRVDSIGHAERDGMLVIKQRVMIEGDPPRDRIWRLRRTSTGNYSGTLSDAVGPVTAQTIGNSILISYSMKGNLKVSQILTPIDNGRAVDNRMTIRKWGMKVASLTERIEKR
jgi:hypothetical protein